MTDHDVPWFDGDVPPGEVGISRPQWDELIARAERDGEAR